MPSLFIRPAGYNSYNGYYRGGKVRRRVCGACGLGDVVANLAEEVAEGGGIAGFDDGGGLSEFGTYGA